MFVLLQFVLLCWAVGALPVHNKIVNGTDAQPGEIPYIVTLKYVGKLTCGGSILDARHILTAAHCVDDRDSDPSLFTITYGTIYQSDSLNTITVEKIIWHEDFVPGNGYMNDVAVLRLASPIIFSATVQPTVLPHQFDETPAGHDCILAGWGRPQDDLPTTEKLQIVDLKVYSDAACSEAHSGVTNGRYHICAGIPEGGKGQCKGDSGGPLHVNGVQVGIVSWSVKPCTIKGYPGVYTKVSMYVPWIQKMLLV